MIGIQETVENVCRRDEAKYQGKAYRYGSRVRVMRLNGYGRDGTVIDCGSDHGHPGFDYVDQSGDEWWALDSQIVKVLVY